VGDLKEQDHHAEESLQKESSLTDTLSSLAKATAQVNNASRTILSLMSNSPQHQYFFIQDLQWLLVPALLHRQFRIFWIQNIPVDYISWAGISEETEVRLLRSHPRLRPDEWTGGDWLWVIDFFCPPGDKDELKDAIMAPFEGKEVWVRGGNGNASVRFESLCDYKVNP